MREFGLRLPLVRSALTIAFAASALINLLALTGSFFMLQVYDRVLPSRSIPSLVALSILAFVLYAGQWALDVLRSRLFARLAALLDRRLSPALFARMRQLALAKPGAGFGEQIVRDLDQMRSFVGTGALSGFFDLPWIPVYLLICYLFHPLIGIATTVGAVILLLLTLVTDIRTRRPSGQAAEAASGRSGILSAFQSNAEALTAMGMSDRFIAELAGRQERYVEAVRQVADRGGFFASLSKTFRMALQSAVLGFGAYLVIENEATAGIIIASSILSSRALAPIEQVIAHWKVTVAARQSLSRIKSLLAATPMRERHVALPRPHRSLQVENLTLMAPAGGRAILNNVSFTLRAGNALGIVGPSASGKSSLARALTGIWQPARGAIRLDGATLDQWGETALGRHVGYLPQDVELFEGSIAQNIARFEPDAPSDEIIDAARRAGLHEMIVRLPQGYDTPIGAGGALSAGQRQLVGLARALFRSPFLIVLDEPNAHLDTDGEAALLKAVDSARNAGSIVVLIAHRPNALVAVDHMLVLADGKAKAFGPRDEILRAAVRPVQTPAAAEQRLGAA